MEQGASDPMLHQGLKVWSYGPAHPARNPTQKSVTSFLVASTVMELWRENLDLGPKSKFKQAAACSSRLTTQL